jgi:S-formylglutathione hydrolase FrmB
MWRLSIWGSRRRTLAALLLLSGCQKETPVVLPVPAGMVDRTFHSAALGRDVTYRVRYPASTLAGKPIHVVYLLHGNGESYRRWSEASTITQLAPADWVLVMPEGQSGYWVNSATAARDRYEDFLTHELIADAERDLTTRGEIDRSIVGNSMGGYGAVLMALKHPRLYRFAGALSPAVDYPERGFTLRRWGQSLGIRSALGPMASAARKANDPFVLAETADPARMPYVWLSCGDSEPLLAPVRRFDAVLTQRGIAHEFHVEHGGHNWGQWNEAMPGLVRAMKPQK